MSHGKLVATANLGYLQRSSIQSKWTMKTLPKVTRMIAARLDKFENVPHAPLAADGLDLGPDTRSASLIEGPLG